MSCIKFPSSKNDLAKPPQKENFIEQNSLATTQLISIANQVFGQAKWSHGITNQTLDFVDYVAGKYCAGCASYVKIELKDGTFHEDVGYSFNEGSSKGSAIQKARLGSIANAFKKTIMYFGIDVTNKLNKTPSRPNSPVPTEIAPMKILEIEGVISSRTKTSDEAVYTDNIPISQADAFIDNVDLETILVKPKTPIINKNRNQMSVDKSNSIKSTDKINVLDVDSKPSTSANDLKNEVKTEAPKIVVSTVMTEEEMRLERKRKQREMQEEFKRKQEFKKKNCETGSKQIPRY